MCNNPILTALGHTLPIRDGYRTLIHIHIGKTALFGQGCDQKRQTCEGYYRVTVSGLTGPCIASPYTKTTEATLRVLASSLIGSKPRKGQVQTLAATLPYEATVEFEFISEK